MIPSPQTAAEVLEREFLGIRARILEIGAMLDRLDRAEGDMRSDPRRQRIDQAIAILARQDATRAEQIQMIFSLAFEDDWQQQFQRQGWQSANQPPAKPK